MNHNRIFVYFLLYALLHNINILAQKTNQTYLNYIEKFSNLALIQQNEYGIPASITLAQGLLESGAGLGELAKKSNNHFGIKCSDWQGDKVYFDDDAKNECFRKYDDVLASYEDHSLFLKNRSRYSFLFDLSAIDYEAWAHGLKKAGYATDPTYAYKLISIIDNYELHKFDLVKSVNELIKTEENTSSVNQAPIGKIDAYTVHKVLKNNQVRYVVSQKGDTYSGIADEFDLDEMKLRSYNEVDENRVLNENMIVYLKSKKNKASRKDFTHTVKIGETMYGISQLYAIKIEKLYLLNSMSFDQGAKLDQILKLR
jgi:LysM repeat protein